MARALGISFSKDNVRHIVNVIEYLEVRNDKPAALMFIDTEKAFDNVSWQFLKKSMGLMGVEGAFMKGIEAIYSKQRAKFIVNNVFTESFDITKGTRQGCPLSPLLFIIVLEILTNLLRKTKEIRGIKIGVKEFKLKAYADDLVLTLEEPQISVMKAMEEMEEFGRLSGLKLNKTKRKLVVKNITK